MHFDYENIDGGVKMPLRASVFTPGIIFLISKIKKEHKTYGTDR